MCILSHKAVCAERVYLLEEEVAYIGKSSQVADTVFAQRHASVCRPMVVDDTNVIRWKQFTVAEMKPSVLVPQPDSTETLLVATYTYDILTGLRFPYAAPQRVKFSAELPLVGTELFYLPVRDDISVLTNKAEGIWSLMVSERLEPHFQGSWAYRTKPRNDGSIDVDGPVVFSADKTIIAGYYSKRLQVKPLSFESMSGDLVIRISPPEAFYGPDETGATRERELLRKYERLEGRYSFRMVWADSPDGRAIRLPKLVAAKLQEFQK